MPLLDAFLLKNSPAAGIVFVGALSALIAVAVSFIQQHGMRWALLIVIPLAISYLLYWHLAKVEGGPIEEYEAWQFAFLILEGGPGVAVSILVAEATRKWRRSNTRTPGA